MNFTRLENTIRRDEGFSETVYLDTVGIPTIGYGTTRIMGERVTTDTPPISEQVARGLMRSDLYRACAEAQGLFSRFDEMDSARQEVLANMCYNLGATRLGKFRKLIAAAEKLDYNIMAWEMRDSRWFVQVGGRGERLYHQMRTGEAR